MLVAASARQLPHERDEGEREPPDARYPWDGVSGVRPYRGFAAATKTWVFYTDGDAQYDVRELKLLAEQVSWTKERAQIQTRLDTLAIEREAAMSGVAEKDLALYARLRDSMGGNALAILKDGSCSACGVGISASESQTVRNSAELFRCPQCGRILYAG